MSYRKYTKIQLYEIQEGDNLAASLIRKAEQYPLFEKRRV